VACLRQRAALPLRPRRPSSQSTAEPRCGRNTSPPHHISGSGDRLRRWHAYATSMQSARDLLLQRLAEDSTAAAAAATLGALCPELHGKLERLVPAAVLPTTTRQEGASCEKVCPPPDSQAIFRWCPLFCSLLWPG
jgi:hypothetical protein